MLSVLVVKIFYQELQIGWFCNDNVKAWVIIEINGFATWAVTLNMQAKLGLKSLNQQLSL